MSEIINNQKKAEKDINKLWEYHRHQKAMIYGTFNRFVEKVGRVFIKNEINTDFADVYLKDE